MDFSGVTLLVKDQQQAKEFFVSQLGFVVRADVSFNNGFRWLTVAPHKQAQTALILTLAEQHNVAMVGRQVGNGVLMVLTTEDFDSKYQEMICNSIVFDEQPRVEVYGKVAIFRDLYGNRWDLLQPHNSSTADDE